MRNLGWLVTALCIFLSSTAHACAVLEHAEPRVGSTTSGLLDAVHLHFSMQIFPKESTLSVLNTNGQAVSVGKPFADPGNNTNLAVKIKNLSPGRYKVVWNVFAACGSHEPGDFKFTVAPPGTTSKETKP